MRTDHPFVQSSASGSRSYHDAHALSATSCTIRAIALVIHCGVAVTSPSGVESIYPVTSEMLLIKANSAP